jgi:hypothetical protein
MATAVATSSQDVATFMVAGQRSMGLFKSFNHMFRDAKQEGCHKVWDKLDLLFFPDTEDT